MTRAPQRGLGTLAIVIGLFLVMGLISAFAARTLMLEQRIAGHHQRGAMADEMAEAGLEWTVAPHTCIIVRRYGFERYDAATCHTSHSMPYCAVANANDVPHCPAPVSVVSLVMPSWWL